MSVTFNLAAYLRQYAAGKDKVTIDGKTVREALDNLVKLYPLLHDQLFDRNDQMHPYVSVFMSGEIIYADKLEKPVKDGATLHILYIIGGG